VLGAIRCGSVDGGGAPGFSDDDLKKVICSGRRERHAAGLAQYAAAVFPGVYGTPMPGMPGSAEGTAMLQELARLLRTANAGPQGRLRPGLRVVVVAGHGHRWEYAKTGALIGDYVSGARRKPDGFTRDRPAARA
jgi:hypothetical protein